MLDYLLSTHRFQSAKCFSAISPLNLPNQLLAYFDKGAKHDFFSLYRLLTPQHKLETQLRVYFLTFQARKNHDLQSRGHESKQLQILLAEDGLMEFKAYIESNSEGHSNAEYYALPFVRNIGDHPVFKIFLTSQWAQEVRSQLDKKVQRDWDKISKAKPIESSHNPESQGSQPQIQSSLLLIEKLYCSLVNAFPNALCSQQMVPLAIQIDKNAKTKHPIMTNSQQLIQDVPPIQFEGMDRGMIKLTIISKEIVQKGMIWRLCHAVTEKLFSDTARAIVASQVLGIGSPYSNSLIPTIWNSPCGCQLLYILIHDPVCMNILLKKAQTIKQFLILLNKLPIDSGLLLHYLRIILKIAQSPLLTMLQQSTAISAVFGLLVPVVKIQNTEAIGICLLIIRHLINSTQTFNQIRDWFVGIEKKFSQGNQAQSAQSPNDESNSANLTDIPDPLVHLYTLVAHPLHSISTLAASLLIHFVCFSRLECSISPQLLLSLKNPTSPIKNINKLSLVKKKKQTAAFHGWLINLCTNPNVQQAIYSWIQNKQHQPTNNPKSDSSTIPLHSQTFYAILKDYYNKDIDQIQSHINSHFRPIKSKRLSQVTAYQLDRHNQNQSRAEAFQIDGSIFALFERPPSQKNKILNHENTKPAKRNSKNREVGQTKGLLNTTSPFITSSIPTFDPKLITGNMCDPAYQQAHQYLLKNFKATKPYKQEKWLKLLNHIDSATLLEKPRKALSNRRSISKGTSQTFLSPKNIVFSPSRTGFEILRHNQQFQSQEQSNQGEKRIDSANRRSSRLIAKRNSISNRKGPQSLSSLGGGRSSGIQDKQKNEGDSLSRDMVMGDIKVQPNPLNGAYQSTTTNPKRRKSSKKDTVQLRSNWLKNHEEYGHKSGSISRGKSRSLLKRSS